MHNDSPLGKTTSYPTRYDASLLFAINRSENRTLLPAVSDWHGEDIWTAYELCWLNSKGKPIMAVGEFHFPFNSPNLVESKSFKLYLNSFNNERFANPNEVKQRMTNDLSALVGAPVKVHFFHLHPYNGPLIHEFEGESIDGLDIDVEDYTAPQPSLLRCEDNAKVLYESLHSDLLKSNCPVTNQPDWASLHIAYTGKKIDRSSLLRYILSFRHHNEFHEHCVERIYCDIMAQCQPKSLFVYARYTRRGGLDINPWRSNQRNAPPSIRLPRQ